MISVKREPFSVVEENQHIISEHWDEIVTDKSGRALDVDWEAFRSMESAGMLCTIIAREDRDVIGYAVFILHRHLHAKATMCAHNDALFLRADHRKGRAGIALIKESEKILSEIAGNVLVFWHVKPSRDFGGLLERIGYKKYETLYARNIGG